MDRSTSTYLYLARATAALIVLLEHADIPAITGLPTLRGAARLGDHAIVLFFLLSGISIAYVTQTRELELRDYVTSRLARLYSVVLPALALTVVLDALGRRIDPELYGHWEIVGSHPAAGLLSSLLFCQELWFVSLRPLSDVPFWCVGYVLWYYALFGVARYIESPAKYVLALAIAAVMGPKILILFPVWLLGAWTYRLIASPAIAERTGWILFLGSAVAYAAFLLMHGPAALDEWTLRHLGARLYRQLGWSNIFVADYLVATLAALHFIGLAAIAPRLSKALAAMAHPARYLSSFSFSTYLYHFPLLLFFAALAGRLLQGAPRALLVLPCTVAAIWMLGSVTERRRYRLERWLAQALTGVERRLSLRSSG